MVDVAKRCFDVGFAGITLVILSPLMIFIAILIKLDSKGTVFYRGTRIGLNGEPFRIYKFRTMQPNAELMGTTTVINDTRVTCIGKVLRKYKIDEIPQMINVLKNEMSIVGPRPEVEEHTAVYTEEERKILDVKPGVTDFASMKFADLASVLGSEDPHTVYVTKVRAEKNRLRLEYVYRRSFWVDLRIVFMTIVIILSKIRQKEQ